MATGLRCCRHPENVANQFLRNSNGMGDTCDSLTQMNFEDLMKTYEKKLNSDFI